MHDLRKFGVGAILENHLIINIIEKQIGRFFILNKTFKDMKPCTMGGGRGSTNLGEKGVLWMITNY